MNFGGGKNDKIIEVRKGGEDPSNENESVYLVYGLKFNLLSIS